MKADLPAAIVIGGTTQALGIVRALGQQGVPVIVVHFDDSDTAGFSRYVIGREMAPHPEQCEEQFLDAVMKHIRKYDARILFPGSDQAVVTVSRNRQLLADHCQIACTDWSTAKIFIDKKHTYQLAEENCVAAPKTLVPTSMEEVRDFCERVDFPCLIKPSQSHLFVKHFGRKMLPVSNADELVSAYSKCTELGLEMLIQEIIPGDDRCVVNYNALFIDGTPMVEATAVHTRNGPPLWGSPRVAQSRHIPEIIQPGRRILQAIGYSGFACTEFKRDSRDGRYKLMEVNVRHNLSTTLSVRSGINFPWLEYNYVVRGVAPHQPEMQEGIFWIDLIRDVGHSLKNLNSEGMTLPAFLKPYLGSHTFAIWDLLDPMPFLRRSLKLIFTGFRMTSSGRGARLTSAPGGQDRPNTASRDRPSVQK